MDGQEKPRKRQREHEYPGEKATRSKAGAEIPSLKEVEEFFEILRRMQVAVKYFDNKVNGDGHGKRFSGTLWDALETRRIESANAPTATTSEGDCSNLRAKTVAKELVTENSRVFDLNSEPDQDIT